MTAENQGISAYDAVIADLRAQRDKIDQTIALLTSLRGGAGMTQDGVNAASNGESGIVETAGMFLGMSIVDAAKKLLAIRKRTLGNSDIARELQAGGLVMTSKDPVNTVGSVLTRRFNEVGDVVKVGRGIWGLKEWYPGRNFKAAVKASIASSIAANPESDWDEGDSGMEAQPSLEDMPQIAPASHQSSHITEVDGGEF